jgi:hypothetical protein
MPAVKFFACLDLDPICDGHQWCPSISGWALSQNTDGQKQATKRLKYTTLKTFFYFIKNMEGQALLNPCDTAMLRKTFRSARGQQWTILGKDTVDEIIFKTDKSRNRLMLELMARGGMRIGEAIPEPVWLSKKLAERLESRFAPMIYSVMRPLMPVAPAHHWKSCQRSSSGTLKGVTPNI